MNAERVVHSGGWTGFQGVNRGDSGRNTATADLINILDTIEVPIVVVRSDLVIACFNMAAADVVGLSPSDIGRASRDISALAGSPRLEQQCSQVITSGLESRVDFRDEDKWFIVRISPYATGDHHIDGAVLTFTNVTAFRASVNQALYEREFTKAILNTVADPLIVLSADQRIQSGNRAFYTMFGISRDEAQGGLLYELGNGALELAPLRKQLREILTGSDPFQPVEVDHVFTAKGQLTLILDAHPLSLPGHSERRVLVTFQDVTARKQADAAKDLRSEEELRRSAEKIRCLVEANVVGIAMWTLDGAIIGANEAFLRIVQYSREDLASGPVRWTDLTPTEWRDRDERALADLKATGVFQPFEKEYFRKDGSRVPVLLGGALFEGNEGVAFILDLSEQKRAQEDLQRSEAFLAEAQHLSSTGSFAWRVATDEMTWSDEIFRIFELGPPLTPARIRTRVHPEDLASYEKMVEQARNSGSDFEWQYRLMMPDQSIKYLHAVAHATRDQDGQLEYIAAIQDITARRLSEEALRKARADLAHVARVTSLGALAASIAHEVNQPLAAVVTNANACLRFLNHAAPDLDEAREAIRSIIRDGHRGSEVIERIRALVKKEQPSRTRVDINETVGDMVRLAPFGLHGADLQMELAEQLPWVLADRVQLQQVLLNLMVNAIDAMKSVSDRPRILRVGTKRHDGNTVLVSVQDSGIGIEPEALEQLFETFYTTKPDGMGMGLSISHSIIESHGGRLWANRNDGPGATFYFTLPAEHGAVT